MLLNRPVQIDIADGKAAGGGGGSGEALKGMVMVGSVYVVGVLLQMSLGVAWVEIAGG